MFNEEDATQSIQGKAKTGEDFRTEAIQNYVNGNYPRSEAEAEIINKFNENLGRKKFELKLQQPKFEDDYQDSLKNRRTITGPIVIALDPVTEGLLAIGDAVAERVVRSVDSGFLLLDSKYDLLAANGVVPWSYMFLETPFMKYLKKIAGSDEVSLIYSRSQIAQKQKDALELQCGGIKVTHNYNAGEDILRVNAGSELQRAEEVESRFREDPPFNFSDPLWQYTFIEHRLANIVKTSKIDKLVGVKMKLGGKQDSIAFSMRKTLRDEVAPFTLNYRIVPTGKMVK